jgi:hypothetical protein
VGHTGAGKSVAEVVGVTGAVEPPEPLLEGTPPLGASGGLVIDGDVGAWLPCVDDVHPAAQIASAIVSTAIVRRVMPQAFPLRCETVSS